MSILLVPLHLVDIEKILETVKKCTRKVYNGDRKFEIPIITYRKKYIRFWVPKDYLFIAQSLEEKLVEYINSIAYCEAALQIKYAKHEAQPGWGVYLFYDRKCAAEEKKRIKLRKGILTTC